MDWWKYAHFDFLRSHTKKMGIWSGQLSEQIDMILLAENFGVLLFFSWCVRRSLENFMILTFPLEWVYSKDENYSMATFEMKVSP